MGEMKRMDESAKSTGEFADSNIRRRADERGMKSGEAAAHPGIVRDEEGQVQVEPDWGKGPRAVATNATKEDSASARLFSDAEMGDLRSRWDNVQAEFVDEPKRAVKEADQLVATVMQKLTSGFANERTLLEKQWDSGAEVSTEDLRVALQRYRTFFGRLLNAA